MKEPLSLFSFRYMDFILLGLILILLGFLVVTYTELDELRITVHRIQLEQSLR